MSSLELDATQLHLWFAFPEQEYSEELLSRYWKLASDDERQRNARFHFARDRKRHLITRAMTRVVLSRYAAIAPTDWTFGTNRFGRPQISNPDASAAGLSFNVAHSSTVIVIGITKQRALGVDTENLSIEPDQIEIADRFFAAEESSHLRALAHDKRAERFLEYWTFKEAYVKARGAGLSIPINQVRFKFATDQRVEATIDRAANEEGSDWRFWQVRPTRDDIVAICAEATGADGPPFVMRTIVPLASEALVDYPLHRVSPDNLQDESLDLTFQ